VPQQRRRSYPPNARFTGCHDCSNGDRASTPARVKQDHAHPPGTPESISVLACEHPDDEIADGVLTGDAQFIADVGRPDLLDSTDVTADELGHQRYDSIQRKRMGQPSQTVPPVQETRSSPQSHS